MYCIVFSGRLLEGYDPQVVRLAVANRLKLDAVQVERLFCGERVVLKKGITEDSGRLYLDVLRRLGLDAGMARIPRVADTVQALATFKVVFWGRVLDGFAREAVMQAAAVRLRVPLAQLERMFNGSKAVLKRGVASDVGTRYVLELAKIGMQIDLEVETAEVASEVRAFKAEPVLSEPVVPAKERSAGFRRHDDESYAGLLQTQFELPGSSDYAEELAQPSQDERAEALAVSSYHAPTKTVRPPQPIEPIALPVQAAVPLEYVRCEQCGHRQTLGSSCRVCGTNMRRAVAPSIPMDASAYAAQTTILGNMPSAMLRGSVAVPAPASARNELRAQMKAQMRRQDQTAHKKSFMQGRASLLVGIGLAVSALLWLMV